MAEFCAGGANPRSVERSGARGALIVNRHLTRLDTRRPIVNLDPAHLNRSGKCG